MMRVTRSVIALVLLAFASIAGSASVVSAQGGESASATEARPPRGARQGVRPQVQSDRQALQRRVRQAFAGVVRRQLNLDPSQMRTLQRVDQKYEHQRRAILRDEREARVNLKVAMQDSSAHPDQDKISQYLDQIVHAQRRRADLLEAEQKEFGTFLSPMQRAQYFALKERVNRRLLELQRADTTGGRGAPPPPAP